jgi:NodT family efflux transporter outer membrane factor (OMF) lipoprotein
VALLWAALGAGCTVGPNYSAPTPAVAEAFSEVRGAPQDGDKLVSRPESGVEATARWWYRFHDAELESLIQRAQKGNRDLKLAAARVREARLQRAVATSGFWPAIDLTGGYNRGHGSENVELPFGNPAGGSGGAGAAASGSAADGPTGQMADAAPGAAGISAPASGAVMPPSGGNRPAGPASPLGEGGLPGVTTNLYQAGFDASWEIDLFGGKRRALESATAQLQAVEEAERAAMVTLLGEVAETYLQLRAGQRRLELAQQNLQVAKDVLAIVQAKFDTGFATDLEVARQSAEVATIEATQPALQTAERISIHALSVMIGEQPGALAAELSRSSPLPELPPEVPVGLPSDLLRRRPDVRQAEREVAAASAQIGVATAGLLPQFNLAAAFGFDSSKPGDLVEWSSHYYSVTPGVRFPLLDWGRAKTNVRLSDEAARAAGLRYESVVAQAMLDVENALVRFRNEQVARAARAEALAANRRAFTIARQRYEQGLVDSLVVLEAQRTLLSAEDALAQSEALVRLQLVALYKALGGGWES